MDQLSYKNYFRQNTGPRYQNNEISLYDKGNAESMAIYGIQLDYYPVIVDVNKKVTVGFGEDTTKSYLRKFKVMAKLADDGFDENLLYTGFGELNNIEFRLFLHLPSFVKLVGREPIIGDQFYIPHNSTFVYEVSHAVHAALGRDGNFFGFKSAFVINARERAVSPQSAGYGERFGVVDSQGNLRADAPADALVDDGSGRIRDKYAVQQPQVSIDIRHDNDAVEDAVDGTGQGDGISPLKSQDLKNRWGDW
jgi:hypothetical protein